MNIGRFKNQPIFVERMRKMLNNNKMIYTIGQLKELNFSYYQINSMIKNGTLKKINRSHYENLDYTGSFKELAYVCANVPNGVICLLSAASFYGLTNVRPLQIDIAINKNDYIPPLPDFPPINIKYYNKKRHEAGIITIQDEHDNFRIYDLEKTVIDIIYYREKIGIEETKEVLMNYLSRKDRNFKKLLEYSRNFNCYTTIIKYMEVLL